ncbi:hypothetical protein IFM89_032436 [Coptis chinensis]|uniref:Uncharacterized protein n=1 Tax=Coptis chinensis TaxID=261450 RepID=A0A835I684_9MAGN|nr:hypothetical protein IFM89_032436 [Coptis chinensis]
MPNAFPYSIGIPRQANAANRTNLRHKGAAKRLHWRQSTAVAHFSFKNFFTSIGIPRQPIEQTHDTKREEALRHLEKYQQSVKKLHDKNARREHSGRGDWVLRENWMTHRAKVEAWEGPFIVEKTGPKGYYVLKTLSGDFLPKPWNATRLRKFYH